MEEGSPLIALKRISNPISFAHLKRDGKHILLLADVHSDSNSECKSCKAPECLNYITLIKSLDIYARKQTLDYDVFLEMGAPPNTTLSVRKQQLALDREYRRKTRRAGHKLRITNARKEFGEKVYLHEGQQQQRYHYTDMRWLPLIRLFGFFIELVADPEQKLLDDYYNLFQLLYPTKKKLESTILDLCFSTRLRTVPQLQSSLPESRTKIADQVSKLPRSEQQFLRRVITDRLHRIGRIYNYQDKNEFPRAFFAMTAIFMDTYLLARFLRYFRIQKMGGYTVILAGAAHIAVYMEFLKKWDVQVEEIVNPEPLTKILSQQVDDSTLLGEPHCVSLRSTRRNRTSKRR